MAKDFLSEPPEASQQDSAPADDRANREPVRIMVVGSPQGITTVVNWLVRLGFAQMGDWSDLQRAPHTGQWMRVLTKWLQKN
ncbi:MAG: hypothetical protein MUE44_23925 [Oscillatoriaceae cyanobacterium Prado104]|jgi:hypothetical protein|nr:hypothetical protein [Oscillatoriaceae cyanobacterium Prado104]